MLCFFLPPPNNSIKTKYFLEIFFIEILYCMKIGIENFNDFEMKAQWCELKGSDK